MKNKGKSYVQRKQRKHDNYSTPYSMTEQLLEHEKFDFSSLSQKEVLEPACGEKAIVNVLSFYVDCGNLIFYDKKHGIDFFEETIQYDYIITNPPFSLASEFVQKAKEIAKEKFAMLLPLSYLHGQKRYKEKIFTDKNYPLTKVYVFTRYPLLTDIIREDGKYNTGMQVYAWFIWENMEEIKKIINSEKCISWQNFRKGIQASYPIIKWIDNDKYVLRKNNC